MKNDLRITNGLFGRFILYCLVGWIAHQTLNANVVLTVTNDGDTARSYRVLSFNGTTWSSINTASSLAAHTSAQPYGPGGGNMSGISAVRVQWGTAGSIPTLCSLPDGSCWEDYGGPGANLNAEWQTNKFVILVNNNASLEFTSTPLPPPPSTFGLSVRIDNQTWNWQHYTATIANTGELLASADLAPGEMSSVLVSYDCQTNIIPIRFKSTADSFPMLDVTLGSGIEPANPGWWLCDFPRTDVLVHSSAMVGGPTNSMAIDLNTNEFGNLTNSLTEGTFLAAASQQFKADRDAQQTMIGILRTIGEGVNGTGLSNAANNVQSAGASLNQSASNLVSASVGMSNAVAGMGALTNIERTLKFGEGDANTNGWGEVPSGFGSVSNQFMGVYNNVGSLTNGVETGSHDADFWKVNVPHYGIVDFYPMVDGLGGIAAFFKQAFTWFLFVEYLIHIGKLASKALDKIGTFQQGGSPMIGGEILGTGVKSSLISWVVVRVMLGAALLAFIGGVFAWYDGLGVTSLISQLGGGPFAGVGLRGQGYVEAVNIVDKWVPLNLIVWSAMMHIFAWIPLGLLTSAGAIGIRMIPKCIILTGILWTSSQVQASNIIDVWNYRTNTVAVDTNLFLPPGGQLTLNDRESIEIDGTSVPLADNQHIRLNLGDGLIHSTADDLWTSYFYLGLSAGGVWITLKLVIWIYRLVSKASTESDAF